MVASKLLHPHDLLSDIVGQHGLEKVMTGLPMHITGIPKTIAQEQVSIGFVHAIAGQSGLNISKWEFDDGIDLEIGSTKPMRGITRFAGVRFGCQLKASKVWKKHGDFIHYNLPAKNYNKLRNPDNTAPQYLILYTLPELRRDWISDLGDNTLFQHCAFYYKLTGMPELQDRADGKPRCSVTIRIPIENRLTACSLIKLYRDAATDYERLKNGGAA